MINRFLIFGVFVILILIVVRKIANLIIKKFNSKNIQNPVSNQSVLVKCSKCGVMVPREYVDSKGEQTFYCKDHSNEKQ